MRKIFIAATAALALSMSAMAQDLSFIVNVGYQGANLTNIDTGKAKADLLSGFRGGVALDWTFLDFGAGELSLQPGVYFSMKGSQLNLSGKDTPASQARAVTQQLNYIDVPVLVNARFGVADHTNVFVNAGPYLGFGINANNKVKKGAEVEGSSDVDLFKEKIFNRFDWGLHVGAGVEFNHFMLGVGYQMGIQDIKKGVQATESGLGNRIENLIRNNSSKVNNSNFFVTLGYRF